MNAPAFQLYASDFYMDTASWSPSEVGIYFRLLIWEWVNGPIPDDLRKMARIAGCDPKTLDTSWKTCIGEKFIINGCRGREISRPMYQGKIPTTNGVCGWENSRLERTRKEQQEYREKLANSGRLGGLKTQEKKRKKQSKASSKASSENKALLSSSSSSSLKEKNKYLDFVFLTSEEYEKLINKFGHDDCDEWIKRLNDGIGSKGYKYTSHYHTILNWDRMEKQKNKPPESEIDKWIRQSSV